MNEARAEKYAVCGWAELNYSSIQYLWMKLWIVPRMRQWLKAI